MPQLITKPTVIEAVGNKPKLIQEFVGGVNTGHSSVSVARMTSSEGWKEPGQRPNFEEITLVLSGMVRVEHEHGSIDVHAGEAVLVKPKEWVRYRTPNTDGAQYIAVCIPAFSPDTVNRD